MKTMEQWKGKVAVVSGASSGIGKGIALKLAEDGMTVIALARRKEKLQELEANFKGKGQLKGYVCDVTNDPQVEETFNKIQKEIGKIRVLVNSAANYFHLKLEDFDVDKWRQMMEAHFYGTFICIKYLTKLVKKDDPGTVHVININTAMPTGSNLEMFLPHMATKIPPIMLTEALAREYAKNKINIKTTSLNPGSVRTELVLDTAKEHDELKKFLDCMLKPSELGEAVEMIICAPENAVIPSFTMQPVGEVF